MASSPQGAFVNFVPSKNKIHDIFKSPSLFCVLRWQGKIFVMPYEFKSLKKKWNNYWNLYPIYNLTFNSQLKLSPLHWEQWKNGAAIQLHTLIEFLSCSLFSAESWHCANWQNSGQYVASSPQGVFVNFVASKNKIHDIFKSPSLYCVHRWHGKIFLMPHEFSSMKIYLKKKYWNLYLFHNLLLIPYIGYLYIGFQLSTLIVKQQH